jgi:hypothetical protein
VKKGVGEGRLSGVQVTGDESRAADIGDADLQLVDVGERIRDGRRAHE